MAGQSEPSPPSGAGCRDPHDLPSWCQGCPNGALPARVPWDRRGGESRLQHCWATWLTDTLPGTCCMVLAMGITHLGAPLIENDLHVQNFPELLQVERTEG